MSPLTLRPLTSSDPPTLSAAFAAQGWDKPTAQYEAYWHAQQAGMRDVLIAEWAGAFAGYVTIVWTSDYPPFREANIPEIVDFNVLQKFQRQGVGTALMDEAERRIATHRPVAGIGVGLMHDYGNAQILYVKRGYIPDGRGLFTGGKWLSYGDLARVDDNLTLYFTKPLFPPPADRFTAQTALLHQTFATPSHSLDTLLAHMRQTGQSAIYLSGSRLDHAYGFVSSDLGLLLSALPEDGVKAATPGYHPKSEETYHLFQGTITLEMLVEGEIQAKELHAYETYPIPAGQCHRVRPAPRQQAASLIVKTNLHSQPGVVRCNSCTYFANKTDCPLFQRHSIDETEVSSLNPSHS